MKNVVRRPLKMIAAAMFMVALGYGVATNLEVSESGKTNDVTLSALGSVSAQGEEGSIGARCYATSRGRPWFGGYSILRCQGHGNCRRVRVREYSDPSTC